MEVFPVRIPLHVFCSRSNAKVVYPSTTENFAGNNLKQGHCDLSVTESRICYKPKGYLHYKRINSQNMLSEAQVKIFFRRKVMFRSEDTQVLFSSSIPQFTKAQGALLKIYFEAQFIKSPNIANW